jgi:type I restriction enzyme S subunit
VTRKYASGALEDFCNVEYGTRVVRKKDSGTLYPVYGGGGATFFLDSYNREDRVVIARFAMSEQCVRRVAGKFALNDSGLTVSTKDSSFLRQDLLDYIILSLNDEIYDISRGTAQRNLNVQQFRKMAINFPLGEPEQQAIVGKLDAAFAEIDELDRVSKSQINLAKNVIAAYFDKILNTEGNSAITLLPLDELAEKVVVAFVGRTSQFYAETGIPFLRTQNVSRQGIQVDKLKFVTKEFHEKNLKSQLAAGDVLLSRVITDRVTVGVVPSRIIPSNCANVIIIRPGAKLIPEYLASYISSPSSQRYLLSRKVGSAQVVVNTGIVKNWPIPFISLEEQKKVSGQITKMSDLVADLGGKLRSKSELFDELRSALLHEAFPLESNVT